MLQGNASCFKVLSFAPMLTFLGDSQCSRPPSEVSVRFTLKSFHPVPVAIVPSYPVGFCNALNLARAAADLKTSGS